MKLDAEFFTRPAGQFAVVGVVVVLCGGALLWQYHQRRTGKLNVAKPAAPALLPKIFAREGTRITVAKSTPAAIQTGATPAAAAVAAQPTVKPTVKPAVLPLTVFVTEAKSEKISAPFGRLIPCETVTALESNRLDTPVIGLVTEDVWHDGRLVVPAGTEVHGRAALDRERERIAVNGQWVIVWRKPGPDNGTELTVQGLALDREGDADGSAGLRGDVLRNGGDRELRLFAATFLSTATLALQNLRTSTGPLGESDLPATTARNATLAGTGAVLREYATQLRDAIARDGFYIRVPAGKPFYLYVTQTLNRSLPGSVHP